MNAHLIGSISALAALGFSPVAMGQSLFLQPVPPAPPVPGSSAPPAPGEPAPSQPAPAPPAPAAAAPALQQVSLMFVIPPTPKTWRKHDKVEVIINETSVSKFEQSLDTQKQYDLKAELSQFPSLEALFADLALRNGIGGTKPSVGLSTDRKFKGDGAYERKDKLTARISGLVLDVKPNGLLVVEAREVVQSDEETSTMVLSGVVDPKDITTSGTVQSGQMANLVIRVEHQGQVKKAGEKGLIPRVFEAVFDF
jgi:flagellar L-ring protein precursor FlgH